MIKFTVETKNNNFSALKNLDKNTRTAALTAARITIADLRKNAVDLTAQKYFITKSKINKAITKLPYGFTVKSGMLTLDQFNLSPKKSSKRRYKLKAGVYRGGLISFGSNAFIKKNKPVIRLSPKRYPLKTLTGPSIAQLVGNEEIMEQVYEEADAKFYDTLNDYMRRTGVLP